MDRVRKRYTFLLDNNHLDERVAEYTFSKDGSEVLVEDVLSPRHDRITIPAAKQSQELSMLLSSIGQIQISWSRNSSFPRLVPFHIVDEPGLQIGTCLECSWDLISDLLKTLLGSSFSYSQPSIVQAANWKSYHEDLGFIKVLPATELSNHVPNSDFDSLTIRYGSLPKSPSSHHKIDDLVIELYWSSRKQPEKISKAKDEKVEVGILSIAPSYSTREEWALSGMIRNMDETEAQKTLVQVALKHIWQSDQSFTSGFVKPVGLHPKHQLQFNSIKNPYSQFPGYCKLYASYNIPKSLFLDKYQLADLDRSTASAPATGKLIGVWGETDLEAPVWVVDGWGSEALVEIYPHSADASMNFEFGLPMHSRYQDPQYNETLTNHTMPKPVVFWACLDAENRPTSEFKSLGYESLFPDETIFYHIPVAESEVYDEYQIPIAPIESYHVVHAVTITVILGGFLWLLFRIFANVNPRPQKKKQ